MKGTEAWLRPYGFLVQNALSGQDKLLVVLCPNLPTKMTRVLFSLLGEKHVKFCTWTAGRELLVTPIALVLETTFVLLSLVTTMISVRPGYWKGTRIAVYASFN